jgi:hypothetical protein
MGVRRSLLRRCREGKMRVVLRGKEESEEKMKKTGGCPVLPSRKPSSKLWSPLSLLLEQ